jgi:LDH2 family malate/lactate/ureidoglycolate dehydrogenase
MPVSVHNALITAAFRKRGFTEAEASAAARTAASASRHGIKTHNAIKALHLDDHFGSKAGGCVPAAEIERLSTPFKAVAKWDAHRKLGQAVAVAAMDEAMRLADEFGIGAVAVDNAFHYLWGGGYVIDAANKGYIAYTNCTAALAEVVPFGGKFPTLGTNPHSWGFPTTAAIGFPICIDWATSVIATGRVQQYLREKKMLPPGCGVDKLGHPTTDPAQVAALLPFGQHKGYGLALIDELMAAFIGGSLPTLRNRWGKAPSHEKQTCTFFFQCIRPDAIECAFTDKRSQMQNVKHVIQDILGHGNEQCLLPGQPEAEAAKESDRLGGLIFTAAEIEALEAIAKEANFPWNQTSFTTAG